MCTTEHTGTVETNKTTVERVDDRVVLPVTLVVVAGGGVVWAVVGAVDGCCVCVVPGGDGVVATVVVGPAEAVDPVDDKHTHTQSYTDLYHSREFIPSRRVA